MELRRKRKAEPGREQGIQLLTTHSVGANFELPAPNSGSILFQMIDTKNSDDLHYADSVVIAELWDTSDSTVFRVIFKGYERIGEEHEWEDWLNVDLEYVSKTFYWYEKKWAEVFRKRSGHFVLGRFGSPSRSQSFEFKIDRNKLLKFKKQLAEANRKFPVRSRKFQAMLEGRDYWTK